MGREKRSDQMSGPLWVSRCELTYLDLPGTWGPTTVCLILPSEQTLERTVKLLVTGENRKHLALPRGWDMVDIHTRLRGHLAYW